MVKPSGQTLFLSGVILASCVMVGYLVLFHGQLQDEPGDPEPDALSAAAANKNPIDSERAYDYLKQICAIGKRVSGSQGMKRQQKLLVDHFKKLGGQIHFQEFTVRDPKSGSPVSMANLIVQWHPDRKERILLCTHYDTRPFPDRDLRNPTGTFIGANDGGSGTALLMEP